jgi:tetratricopeptide (TPR) repeat protein
MISRALELDPYNGAYLDSLGWVYYRTGKLEEAEACLRRAIQRVSRDPTVHDHLGDVLAKRGKLKEAIAEWQISLKEWEASSQSDKDPAEVAKINKKLEGAKVRLAKESPSPTRKP